MGHQLDSGSPNPVLREEKCLIADLNPCMSHGAVQSCGQIMDLAVVWERLLWLSLSGLSDKEKVEFLNAPIEGQRPCSATCRKRKERHSRSVSPESWPNLIWGTFGLSAYPSHSTTTVGKGGTTAKALCCKTKTVFHGQKHRQPLRETRRSGQPETSVWHQEGFGVSTQSFSVPSLQNDSSLPPAGKKRRNLNVFKSSKFSMAHVLQVPPKELSPSPPSTRFVLREESQKYTSIQKKKLSLMHSGRGLRVQSGIKEEKDHKTLKQSQIKKNVTPVLELYSPFSSTTERRREEPTCCSGAELAHLRNSSLGFNH